MKLRPLVLLLALQFPLLSQAAPIHTYLDIQRGDPAQSASPLDRGFEALNAKQFETARRLFLDAVKAEPKSPLPLLGLADVSRLQKNEQEAELWVNKAHAVAPQSLEALVAMGRLSAARQKWKDAERYFAEAARLAPNALAPQLDLGELYLNALKKPELASEAFRKAAEIKPDHAGARFGLGMALLARQNRTEAAAALTEATRLAPGNPLAFYGLGQAQAARGDYRAAAEAFDNAVALDPRFSAAMVLGAEARQASGDIKAALAQIDQAAKTDPGSAQVRFKQGMLHHVAGDNTGAYAGYLAAVKADPRHALAYNNAAALAASRKERLDEALIWAQKAIEIAPAENAIQDTLAAVHRARGERKEAIRILQRIAISEHPPADSLYQLGILLQENGQNKDAVLAFRHALQIDPAFAEARDSRARISQLDQKR